MSANYDDLEGNIRINILYSKETEGHYLQNMCFLYFKDRVEVKC